MDRTNCSGLSATDVIFQQRPTAAEGDTCSASLVGYTIVCVCLIAVGFAATLKKWRDFIVRKQNGLKASPLVPLLHLGALTGHLLTAILAGVNVINAANGYPFTLISISFAFNALVYLVAYERTVRATSRMIKFSGRESMATGPAFETSMSVANAKELDRIDKWGFISVMLGSVCGFFGVVILAVFAPIFPANQAVIGLVAWNLKAGFFVGLTGALVWQLQRCAVFVQRLEGEGASPTIIKEIMKRIRTRQLGNVASGAINTIYHILVGSQAIPWDWWVVLGIQMFLDAVVAFLVAFTSKVEQVSTMGRRKSSLFFKDPVNRGKPKLFKELGVSGFLGADQVDSSAELRNSTYRFMEGEMQVGTETLVYYIWGRKAALRAAKITENPIVNVTVALYGLVHVALAQCHFVLLEECVPNTILYPWSIVGMIGYVCILATRISLPVAAQVLRTPSFWSRFLSTIILFLCLLDVVAFDERSLTVSITTLLTSVSLFMDALIGNSAPYKFIIYCLVVPLPIMNLFFLQFDILARRRNTMLPILQTATFNYSWSVYQMTLDSNYSLFFLLARDAFKALKRAEYFLYLEAPIYAHIREMNLSGIRPTSMIVNANDLRMALHHGGIVVSDEQGVRYVDRIVMREDDAIAVHILGKERVRGWFTFWSNVYVRAITKIAIGLALLSITVGIFPGIWPKETILIIIYPTIIVFFTMSSFKSLTMLKLLIRRFDFWFDAFLMALVFVAGGVVFAGDIRILAFAFFLLRFLDERTLDARVVLFSHPKFSIGGLCYVVSLMFLMCSIFSIPIGLNLGFVSAPNLEAAIIFRSVDPSTNSTSMGPAPGTFARLRLIQFAANGIAAYAVYQALEQLSSLRRSKEGGIRLQWLSAPILKHYVAFADSTNPVAVRQSVRRQVGIDGAPSSLMPGGMDSWNSRVASDEAATPIVMKRVATLQEMPLPTDDNSDRGSVAANQLS